MRKIKWISTGSLMILQLQLNDNIMTIKLYKYAFCRVMFIISFVGEYTFGIRLNDTTMESLLNYNGIIMISLWYYYGIIIGSLYYHY